MMRFGGRDGVRRCHVGHVQLNCRLAAALQQTPRASARGNACLRHAMVGSSTVVDLAPVLHGTCVESSAREVLRALKATGYVIVRDPRVPTSLNDEYLDMMEDYFARPREAKMRDVRPDIGHQLGATPDNVEQPRCLFDRALQERMAGYQAGHCPAPVTGADVKWRYFWSLRDDAREQVVPDGISHFPQLMDKWGYSLLNAARTVARLLAIGYGLPEGAFVDAMKGGAHLLAPTGTDLVEHGRVGAVFAGYHYDMNFLTIHGRSRYPALHIWRPDGVREPVRLPDGCLLLQAGRQLEWLTGGDIKEGMHEVVCTSATMAAIERRRTSAPGRPLWRVSSTVFSHLGLDVTMAPWVASDDGSTAARLYPPTSTREFIANELQVIKLARAA